VQQPEKLDVVKLFWNAQRYVVPLYQRKYVWGLENQWEPLWRDIRACAEAIERSRTSVGVQHFLGAIVLQEVESEGILRLPAFTIIDGQQRLTTLQVLLAAMRRVASEVNSELAILLQRLTTNEATVDSEVERHKVWPSTFDREAFTVVIDAAPNELTNDHLGSDAQWRTRPRLIEAGAYFERSIRAWLEDAPGETEARIKALHLTLKDSLQVVAIRLDAGEDAQVIFETMNARGVPLRPSDLIRNFLFHQSVQRGEDADYLYNRYWRDFDQEGIGDLGFWSQEEALGRERQQRLVAFLLHFLESQLARELSVNTMFDAFRDWWKSNEPALGSVEAGLALLKQQGAVYRTILRPDPSTPAGAFVERLNTLQYRTAYPLLLHLLTRFKETDESLIEVCQDLESWIIRRYVCRLQTRNYGQTFITLVQRAQRREDSEVGCAIREYLSEFQDDARRWPHDEEFRRAWTSQRAYRRLQVRGIRMILMALEGKLTTRLQEIIAYRPNLSVEHVLPVGWKQNWPAPSEELATPEETAEEVRGRLLHTFGNLTLLTQPLNSKNSNAAYTTKQRLITKESALRLNAHFHDAHSWDEAAILRRAEEMFNTATSIWPRSSAAPSPVANSPTKAEEPPLTLRERHARLREQLKPLLPEDFSITVTTDSYTQIRKESWPREFHYEIGAFSGSIRVGLHSEFGKSDARMPAGHELMGALAPLVQQAFAESDAEFKHKKGTWRNIDLIYDLDVDDGSVLMDLARIVDLTFEFVDEHIKRGLFEAMVA
jgi:hypothetical protein